MAAIVPANYVARVRNSLIDRNQPGDRNAACSCQDQDITSWQTFRAQQIGARTPDEITVAYLAGPEPMNDLEILLECGVRPENIWAFENEPEVFRRGLGELQRAGLRGVKFMPLSLEDYCVGTPRRFDIIYFDACGPLPSREHRTTRVLASIFRNSALAPLGVLISNFSKPDISKQDQLDRYSYLIASYLFPKSFLDVEDGGVTDDASAQGFSLDGGHGTASFIDEVRSNFDHYYGSFITRHIIDLGTLIAPLVRLADSGLYKQLFDANLSKAIARGQRFVKFNAAAFDEENDTADIDCDGDAISDASMFSLLWALAACGCYPTDSNITPPPPAMKDFLERWVDQLRGRPDGKPRVPDIMAAYYAWREDDGLWSEPMKPLAQYSYIKRMPFLCDAPTKEIGFYPAIAQVAFPAHCNIRDAKRFKYIAEGKSTAMFLDVLAFDECRYVYDWLSALHLVPDDWNDLSAQLTFRFALDAIAKERRWYGDDFLFGCHIMGTNDGFPASELAARETRPSPATAP